MQIARCPPNTGAVALDGKVLRGAAASEELAAHLLAVTTHQTHQSGGAYINAGIYVCDISILDLIPDDRSALLEKDIFPQLTGHRFFGMTGSGYFVDIGRLESHANLQSKPEPLLCATLAAR